MSSKTRNLFWLGLLFTALLGSTLLILATSFGVGLVNDSVGYVGGARNIITGKGYSRTVGDWTTRPITNYPPLYSLLLAGVSFTGLDVVDAARWLNVLLFGLNACLIGWFGAKASGAALAGIGAALTMVISEPFLRTHNMAMSEPLYLALNFLAYWCMVRYARGGRIWLVGAGVVSGLAYLTRYIGVTIFAVVLLVILANQNGWRRRLADAGIFLAAGLPLPGIWIIRNLSVTGNTGNRLFAFHPIPADKWVEGVRNIAGWLLPETFGLVDRFLAVWAVFILISLLLMWAMAVWKLGRAFRRDTQLTPPNNISVLLYLLQGSVYPLLLIFTLTFIDASPIFEYRILAPLFVSVIILGAYGLTRLWQKNGHILRMGLLLGIIIIALSLGRDTVNALTELSRDGVGFASNQWRESETIKAVSSLPEDVRIFSSKPTGIYILTGRPSYILPSPTNPATDMPRAGYRESLEYMQSEVNEGKAVAVIFGYSDLQVDPENASWILDLTRNIQEALKLQDGVVFGRLPDS